MKTKILVGSMTLAALTLSAFIAMPALAHDQGAGERPTFETLDANGDGNITVAEAQAFATSRFNERDANGDGVLSVEELQAAAAGRAAEQTNKRVAMMIEWRDTDGDGALSQSELGGNRGERMFGRMDQDADGMISAEEFEEAAERGHRGHGGKRGHRQGG